MITNDVVQYSILLISTTVRDYGAITVILDYKVIWYY